MRQFQLGPWLCAWIAGVLCLGATSCRRAPSFDTETVQILVRAILEQQEKDWNEGHLERFMRAYAPADDTRFASGAEVQKGWTRLLERYKSKYPDKPAMGTLSFTDVDITVLSADSALAFGRWRLQRASDSPSGLFTLVFRKSTDGWRIIHDHTSSKPP